MKLNHLGDVCYASEAGLFVNETLLDERHCTDATWRVDDAVAYQVEVAAPDSWRVATHENVVASKPTYATTYGASPVRAGGDSLAWWTLAGGVMMEAVADPWPAAGLCDVSPEGRLVLTPIYQLGEGLRIYDTAGVLLTQRPTAPLGAAAGTGYNVRLRGDTLLYQDVDGWHLPDRAFVPRTEPIALAVPVPLPNGRVALLELSNTRLTLRYADRTVGIVLIEGNSFYPDAMRLDSGLIAIAWSTATLEAPAFLGRAYVTAAELSAATTELNALPPPVPIDCIVGAWVCGPWHPLSATAEARTCTRPVTQAPQHGGAACPALTKVETRPIEPPDPIEPEEPVVPRILADADRLNHFKDAAWLVHSDYPTLPFNPDSDTVSKPVGQLYNDHIIEECRQINDDAFRDESRQQQKERDGTAEELRDAFKIRRTRQPLDAAETSLHEFVRRSVFLR